jgi:hypothetical protein
LFFFGGDDYQTYKIFFRDAFSKAEVKFWAYCLMPNHVHLIVTPKSEDGLRWFLVRRIDAIPDMLILGRGGVVIYGKEDSILL